MQVQEECRRLLALNAVHLHLAAVTVGKETRNTRALTLEPYLRCERVERDLLGGINIVAASLRIAPRVRRNRIVNARSRVSCQTQILERHTQHHHVCIHDVRVGIAPSAIKRVPIGYFPGIPIRLPHLHEWVIQTLFGPHLKVVVGLTVTVGIERHLKLTSRVHGIPNTPG